MSLRQYHFHEPAEVESLKALLAEGLSRSEIGARLGMSRSAVCGLVFRLHAAGVELPPVSRPAGRPVLPRPARPARPAKAKAAKAATVVPLRPCDSARRETLYLPVEITSTAVTLIELGDNACHWPVSGEGRATMFCGADRNGSSHDSYCRHHAARSVAIDGPRVFAAECPRPLFSA